METPWLVRRAVCDLRPGDHAWLAYATEDERRQVLGAFIRAGLASRDKVILLVRTGLHATAPSALTTRVTVLPFTTCGTVATERLLSELIGQIAEAERQGYQHIRIAADMSWAVRLPGGLAALLDCERRIEAAVSPSTAAIAICHIDRRGCLPEVLAALREAHGVSVTADPMFVDGVLRIEPSFQPLGLILDGELDVSRHAVFGEALSAMLRRANGDPIHLDLARLEFIDLGALNMLAETAMHRAGSGPLVLDRISLQLRTVLEAVGWDMLPGLRLGNPGG
jgi:anti-anti-sigma regulatory factor